MPSQSGSDYAISSDRNIRKRNSPEFTWQATKNPYFFALRVNLRPQKCTVLVEGRITLVVGCPSSINHLLPLC